MRNVFIPARPALDALAQPNHLESSRMNAALSSQMYFGYLFVTNDLTEYKQDNF